MGFGIDKLLGANNTHKKEITKLAKGGYTPQEISDKLQVALPCILSFYKIGMEATDEEMAKFPVVDTSTASNREAQATADAIIADAKKKAAEIAAGPVVDEIPLPDTDTEDAAILAADKPKPAKKKAAKAS